MRWTHEKLNVSFYNESSHYTSKVSHSWKIFRNMLYLWHNVTEISANLIKKEEKKITLGLMVLFSYDKSAI